MNTYIALFRALNVGGKNILPMKELEKFFRTLGYENVRTYMQSGNVVFESDKVVNEKEIVGMSRRIYEKIGFEPAIYVLDQRQLEDAILQNPFPINSGKELHFFFLQSPPKEPDIERLSFIKIESEEFKLTDKVFYLYAPKGIGRSRLAYSVEKALGVTTTARNWNTVKKLSEMVKKA
ncbi:DUF1697 domain-containing protein [uncultured Sphaerochaeta sp.]|uniref:DUF1697 domain-containing protein n=1 Tax=uncultured Sphaerochaeta sp. TaxID=886478 RepID=UPI002A0A7A74|nr:DUF1697 domain-containing protein [uncultured Sphaerochaeta sp.]